MLFSSLTFLFFFLPVVMGLYVILPKAWRIRFLLAASLIFYGWADVRYVFLMLGEILVSWWIGNQIFKSSQPKRKYWLWFGCVIIVGLLVFFKYTDFILSTLNLILPHPIGLLNILLPVGISFYTFQILSYLADLYEGKQQPEKSLITYACYISMFCQLIAGPIVRYSDIHDQIQNPQISWDNFASGITRFVCGLAKKVLLANQLYGFCQEYFAAPSHTVVYAWVYGICNVLYIYFDFSGYSDMAIGLGQMLGLKFPENFNYPLTASNISEFWRRWHMSLTTWFKDYVYIPMGGSRVSKGRWVLNLFVVWILTGLWHGAAWNFVWWGLYFFVLIALEKMIPSLTKLPKILGWIVVWILVIFGFALFSSASMPAFKVWMEQILGWKTAFSDPYSLYQIRSILVILVMAFVGVGKWPQKIFARIKKMKYGWVIQWIAAFGGWFLCIAYLIGGSFNPFLYFRF